MMPTTRPRRRAKDPETTCPGSNPMAWSIENLPGPVKASAAATVAFVRGNSNPPLVFQTPFGKCTARMAFSIAPMMAAAPSGVRNPSASDSPPSVSDPPLRMAMTLPGRYPRDSTLRAVPSRPPPPNQLNSFCVPWPTSRSPTTTRKTKRPMDILSISFRGSFQFSTKLYGRVQFDMPSGTAGAGAAPRGVSRWWRRRPASVRRPAGTARGSHVRTGGG